MNDTVTTIDELKHIFKMFMKERDWEKLNSPKNCTMDLVYQAAELMDLFTFAEDTIEELEKKRQKVENNVADIVFALCNLCLTYNIDITQAVKNKMTINAKKFPI